MAVGIVVHPHGGRDMLDILLRHMLEAQQGVQIFLKQHPRPPAGV